MCCLVWMLFKREFVDVLSGVMLFKREFVDVLSGVDIVYTRICRCAVWCECCLYENL